MGFLNGRVTFVRYRVSGDNPLPFGEELIGLLQEHAIGRHGAVDPTDGVATGWAGGDHLLDVSLDLGKNVVNDALHFALRVDSDKIPGSLLKAYTKIETDARAQLNPSGRPTKAQRLEAKEAALIRAEAEAADGRFRKLAYYPVLWDGRSNSLYAGATSNTVLDRLQTLFRETFDRILIPVTAGSLAYTLAEERGQERAVEDFGPIPFLGESAAATVAWTESDASSRDFWGNEFLLWLWHALQSDGDHVALPDGSRATVMVANTLTLDCPRGVTGRDCLTNDGPTRLPEAFRALQAGKLPRKAGLILVRDDVQYQLTLQAESLAVTGAKLPKAEAPDEETPDFRVDRLRHLVETLDLLYDAYCRRRIGPEWSGELGRIRRWLQAA